MCGREKNFGDFGAKECAVERKSRRDFFEKPPRLFGKTAAVFPNRRRSRAKRHPRNKAQALFVPKVQPIFATNCPEGAIL